MSPNPGREVTDMIQTHPQPTFSFRIPGVLRVGWDVLDELGEQVRRLGAARALIVTDRVMQAQGYVERAGRALQAAGVELTVYDGVNTEPDDRYCAEGLERLRAAGAETVIGLGGGSSIDTAKSVAMLATNG